MPSIEKQLSKALYMEETDLIDSLMNLIKQLNRVYLDEETKELVLKLLNKLLDDSIRHSNMISKMLTELVHE
ncbi:MAG TPA: hypothetical protein VI790_03515 [Candidatus Nanoarchaeia archaeon]|nr:hypothetical protein [Candidatus Nanoarchaeia archaeon]